MTIMVKEINSVTILLRLSSNTTDYYFSALSRFTKRQSLHWIFQTGLQRQRNIQNQLNCFAVHLKLTQHCKPTIVLVLSHFSRVLLFVTPWTVAHQAPLSMGFSRQEYWSELPCPHPGVTLISVCWFFSKSLRVTRILDFIFPCFKETEQDWRLWC